MKKIDVVYSHNSDDWRTPSELYNAFLKSGFIDCFPFQCNYDQLNISYFCKRLFINPPFSKLNLITSWIIDQIVNKNEVALLIPSRTDTNYFHKLLEYQPIIIFIKGRLHYNDSLSAPFPSILLLFNFYSRNDRIYFPMDYESLIGFILTI